MRYPGSGALIVLAGTATSTRMRGEPNAFNLLELDGDRLMLRRFEWQARAQAFGEAAVQRFVRNNGAWMEAP